MGNQQMRVGVIGLGLLGSAMAERLLQHGFAVRGFDLDAKRCEEFTTLGGELAAHSSDVFSACDVVLLSLPTSEVVSAMLGDCRPQLRKGHILIDTTTGDPEQMAALGNQLRNREVNYVEATVAGSSRQMRNGSSILFLGGDVNVIQSIKNVLQTLSPKSFHLGDFGAASRFKLVHNLVLGLHRAVLAEGLSFAESLGFSGAQVLEILKQTPAASAVMETKGEKMVSRDWQPDAKLSQHLKDVRLILEWAERTGTPAPLSQVHRDLLERAGHLGFGDADNAAILEAFRRHPA